MNLLRPAVVRFMGQPPEYPVLINRKDGSIMSKKKNALNHVIFWGVLVLALTAEGWMDLLCRAIF